jgi:diacylglycerol O-acyltransferase
MMSSAKRLSPLDASFLYYEKPHRRLHVGCVAFLDGRLSFDDLVTAMEERLGRIARYRQRPVRPFLDLGWPRWEEDLDFDMRRHFRHVAVPAPGGEAELHELIDTLFATSLDPDRPLWETYFIDGLADGRTVLLCKIHHAMIDGVSGAQLLQVMADPSPRADGGGPADHTPPPRSTTLSRLAALRPAALVEYARDALQAVGTIAALVREPGATLPFNAPISDARRVVWASFPLDEFLVARGVAGCKVNDVVLAVVTGALRSWLLRRGVAPEGLCVRALVPVNVRRAEDHLTLGNLVTAMIARLPIDIADPVERLRCVASEMRALKEQGQARGTGLALQLAGVVPAPASALFARLLPTTSPLNTVITNVPGPREAGYLLGRQILEVHPIPPLFDGMGIEFAIMSYAGRLSISAVADPHLVPDAAEFPAYLYSAAEELQAALVAGKTAPPVPATVGPHVADLMSAEVITLAPTDTLARAWALMLLHRIRHLPVITTDNRLVGIVTHRDVLAASSSVLEVPVEDDRVRILATARAADVMETHVSVVLANDPAALAGERMIRHKIGCLPVVRPDGRLAGIVTEEDFLRWATAHMTPSQPASSRPARASA